MNEDELDLTRLLDPLVRRWWAVISAAIACALVTVVILLFQPESFQAQVIVATVKTSTQVSLGSAIRTLSETDLGTAAVDRRQRMISFGQLIRNPAIAEEVLRAIGDQLPKELRETHVLLDMIQGAVIKDSDALQITASHPNPDVALRVANAWGQEYVRQVNLIYAGTVGESYVAIQGEIQTARAAYDREQAALEAVLRADRYDELTRRISEYEAMVQGMADARGQSVTMLLADLRQTELLLADASDMLAQVRRGGDPAAKSNALALTLLKTQAYTNNTLPDSSRIKQQDQPTWVAGHPLSPSTTDTASDSQQAAVQVVLQGAMNTSAMQLQVAPVAMTAREMANDLEAFIATLQDRRKVVLQELTSLAQEAAESREWTLGTGLSPSIAQIEQRVRDLRADLAREQSHIDSARARRDLAWQGYDSLVRREAEMAIAAQTTEAQVRLAAPARVPKRATVSLIKGGATAAAAGLALGIALAYLFDFLQGYRVRAQAAPRAQL